MRCVKRCPSPEHCTKIHVKPCFPVSLPETPRLKILGKPWVASKLTSLARLSAAILLKRKFFTPSCAWWRQYGRIMDSFPPFFWSSQMFKSFRSLDNLFRWPFDRVSEDSPTEKLILSNFSTCHLDRNFILTPGSSSNITSSICFSKIFSTQNPTSLARSKKARSFSRSHGR